MKPFSIALASLTLALIFSCNLTNKKGNTAQNIAPHNFIITVCRGAFHYDTFILTSQKVCFIPGTDFDFESSKYTLASETSVDSATTSRFLNNIEAQGFWELKEYYVSRSSCLSELRVTLKKDGLSKTVICDDFERNCPEVIQYIERRIIELEGNHLKRVHLPG